MDKQGTKNLKKRYLLWLYKTNKEALDKIERKFTQLEIDNFILKELKKEDKHKRLNPFIDDFQSYLKKKQEDGLSLKYEHKELKPEYLFLAAKLKAIEKAIVVLPVPTSPTKQREGARIISVLSPFSCLSFITATYSKILSLISDKP